MDVTPLVRSDKKIIQSYASEGFKISGTRYEGAVMVMSDQVLEWPAVNGFEDLSVEAFDPLTELDDLPEVLLLGCGDRIQPVPRTIRMPLKEQGIVVEPMDTGAACRTYNVMMAEDRRVAAALLPV